MKALRAKLWRWLKRSIAAMGVLSIAGIITFALLSWCFPFPVERLSRWPQSARVLDRDGRAMIQLVGGDDQWRIGVSLDEMSPWLAAATIAVEDERFRSHPGVDPLAIVRAAGSNVMSGRVVSGASTLSMQVCRMIDDQPRTWRAKLIESFRALQLERVRTKEQILETYLNIAPYGGNIRGVEAASLAYFGKRARDLSLAEAAMIAGLPQSPSRLRPDRHFDRAIRRQQFVLHRMVECKLITATQAHDAQQQELTILDHHGIKRIAPGHGGWLALSRRPMGGQTTIDSTLERDIDAMLREHMQQQPAGTDGAVVVIDIASGDLLALIGSVADGRSGGRTNAAIAKRSPGSALKPFIYAAGFESHRLAANSKLLDVPIERGGWSPSNFDRTFNGEVTVSEALRRSLNIPAILAAEGIGLARCVGVMEAAGIALPRDVVSKGGLAVATGAVEVSLLELTNAYATLGRDGVRQSVRLFDDDPVSAGKALSAQTCAMINEILSTTQRRPRAMQELADHDMPWFMWKTGTSSGRRDAWAVGHNHKVAIGVWIGRQNGSGDVQYVGGDAAEPMLVKLFNHAALRSMRVPPPAASWQVMRPLPPPVEAVKQLRIVSPAAGSQFIALGNGALVPLRCNREAGVQWFLNGKLVDEASAARLIVWPGQHEIRCTQADGSWAKVAFEVR